MLGVRIDEIRAPFHLLGRADGRRDSRYTVPRGGHGIR